MLKSIILAALLMGGAASAFAQIPADRTPQTLQLLQTLKGVASQGKFMFGHHDDTVYGVGWNGDADRSDVESVCGDRPAVIGFDLGQLELQRSAQTAARNLDGVGLERLRHEIVKHYEAGGVITLSWHCNNPLSGRHAWVEKDDVPGSKEAAMRQLENMTVAAILAKRGAVHTEFVNWLDHVAEFLLSLKTSDGTPVPVVFRPWHEHTGSWFWWGQRECTTDDLKALWQLTVNRLTERGVRNALYAYSTGLEAGGDPEKFMERYPGDAYIDLLGIDCYCSTSEPEAEACKHYIEKVAKNVPMLCQLAKDHGKVAAITETGYEGVRTPDWWTKTLLPAMAPFDLAYVMVWRNAHDKKGHFYAPYPGQMSERDFVKFRKDKHTVFLRDMKDMKK